MRYTGTSLRVVRERAKKGDVVADSVLIGREPNEPIGIKGLEYKDCKFVRCLPDKGDKQTNCRFNQAPLPPEPEPEEVVPISKTELAGVISDVTNKAKREKYQAKYEIEAAAVGGEVVHG